MNHITGSAQVEELFDRFDELEQLNVNYIWILVDRAEAIGSDDEDATKLKPSVFEIPSTNINQGLVLNHVSNTISFGTKLGCSFDPASLNTKIEKEKEVCVKKEGLEANKQGEENNYLAERDRRIQEMPDLLNFNIQPRYSSIHRDITDFDFLHNSKRLYKHRLDSMDDIFPLDQDELAFRRGSDIDLSISSIISGFGE